MIRILVTVFLGLVLILALYSFQSAKIKDVSDPIPTNLPKDSKNRVAALKVPLYRPWERYRGMTANAFVTDQLHSLKEKDIQDFSEMGGNILRIMFGNQPLMKKEPPYSFDETAFHFLDQVLDWSEKNGVRVVIDPHSVPGVAGAYTTRPGDAIWQDYKWHDLLVKLWTRIAFQYKDRGSVIAGYDLLNEPYPPVGAENKSPGDWNGLAKKLVSAIRQHDSEHTIIIEAPRRCSYRRVFGECTSYLELPQDTNIVISPHFYAPHRYTYQGISQKPNMYKYPGLIGGRNWNKWQLRKALQPIRDFQKKHKIPIYIGEFGANRHIKSANLYLQDLIELFEEYEWSWTYHSFRSHYSGFDAEVPADDLTLFHDTPTEKTSTPRLELLKSFFKRNGGSVNR